MPEAEPLSDAAVEMIRGRDAESPPHRDGADPLELDVWMFDAAQDRHQLLCELDRCRRASGPATSAGQSERAALS